MGPRRVGYFISGSSRLLANWESTQSRESGFSNRPEKPFTTTDLVPSGASNSDMATVPQNA